MSALVDGLAGTIIDGFPVSRAWLDRGSSFNCNLPNNEYAVRCRTSGRSIREHDAVSFEQLDTTVEGFDPITGKTTWSVAVGATERLRYPNRPSIAGKTEVVIDAREGPIVLDFANGNVRTTAAGETFWCMTTMSYDFSHPYRSWDGRASFSRPGGVVFSICDDRGRPGTSVPDLAATIAAGEQIGSYIMVATKDGYIGFHAR